MSFHSYVTLLEGMSYTNHPETAASRTAAGPATPCDLDPGTSMDQHATARHDMAPWVAPNIPNHMECMGLSIFSHSIVQNSHFCGMPHFETWRTTASYRSALAWRACSFFSFFCFLFFCSSAWLRCNEWGLMGQMGVSINGDPQNGWFIWKIPLKWMI